MCTGDRRFPPQGPARPVRSRQSGGVRPDLADRCHARLAAIHAARRIEDLAVPGWGLLRLLGEQPHWSLTVNGPWRITFAWDGKNALQIDLEQYH